MHFNHRKRHYVNDNGRAVSPAEIRKEIDNYIASEKKDVSKQATLMLGGSITVAAFFDYLKRKIQSWHSIAGVIAYGGEDQMTAKRWQRVGERIKSELNYLTGFKDEVIASVKVTRDLAATAEKIAKATEAIPDGLETVIRERVAEALITSAPAQAQADIASAVVSATADSGVAPEIAQMVAKQVIDATGERIQDLIWGTVETRSQMYTDATFSTYENSVKGRESDAGAIGVRRVCLEDAASCEDCPPLASEEFQSMQDITDIGDSACMSNCRCWFEFEYMGIGPLEIDREIYA